MTSQPHSEQLFRRVREALQHTGNVTPAWTSGMAALRELEEQFDAHRSGLQEAEQALKRIADGAMANPPRQVAAFAREAQDNAHAVLKSNPASSQEALIAEVQRPGSSVSGESYAESLEHAPASRVEEVDLNEGRKVCVYCGGSDHPAECGQPDV